MTVLWGGGFPRRMARMIPVDPAATTDGFDTDTSAEQLAAVLRRYREAMRAALLVDDYRPVPPAAIWLLIALARRRGSVNDLARRLGTTKQAVSRLADRLVSLGYCDRRRSDTNRREVVLRLTAKGLGAATVLRTAIHDLDARIMSRLDQGERQAFQHALDLLATPPSHES